MRDRPSYLYELQADQYTLQREAFGYDLTDLPEGDWAEFVRWNTLALIDETTELLRELPWKPWKKTHKPVDRAAVVSELADMLHFYLNLTLLLDVDADELVDAFHAKQKVNAKRQQDGY